MSRRFEYVRLTGPEFARALDQIGMVPNAFARIFGFEPKRIHNWIDGEDNIPYWVPIVLAIFTGNPSMIINARQEAAERIVSDKQLPGVEFPYLERAPDDHLEDVE
jgi:hypothetical protein